MKTDRLNCGAYLVSRRLGRWCTDGFCTSAASAGAAAAMGRFRRHVCTANTADETSMTQATSIDGGRSGNSGCAAVCGRVDCVLLEATLRLTSKFTSASASPAPELGHVNVRQRWGTSDGARAARSYINCSSAEDRVVRAGGVMPGGSLVRWRGRMQAKRV